MHEETQIDHRRSGGELRHEAAPFQKHKSFILLRTAQPKRLALAVRADDVDDWLAVLVRRYESSHTHTSHTHTLTHTSHNSRTHTESHSYTSHTHTSLTRSHTRLSPSSSADGTCNSLAQIHGRFATWTLDPSGPFAGSTPNLSASFWSERLIGIICHRAVQQKVTSS